ncbi:hypothetical protein H2Y56_22055 [Pectobacterium aroidearum]|uniref:Lipoprotein n=1 Tax=Pectobacterium aroidearum TaxID=1201031 RepID=A0ABR5ZJL0_9GAMM|nr:hypothetical protein [Pectobacterium aroidearum]MBA5234768.1 hypothetical protein [Pectobacterium aroidearum]
MSVSVGSITRGLTLLIFCANLVACKMLPQQIQAQQCAAQRPNLTDSARVGDYFVISEHDMSQLTAYMAALELGCVAPKQ